MSDGIPEEIIIISNVMPEARIAEYMEKDESLIIKTPPDNLIELYLLSFIPQFLYIRAEHDYSIENIDIMPKTLGKYNKRYGDLIGLIKNAKNTEGFAALVRFIRTYSSILPEPCIFNKWTNYCYNIKHSVSLVECLEFIIFKYTFI